MKKCKQLLLLASSLISIGLVQAQSNTPPVAFPQSLVSTQGSSLFIMLTASDANGDPLTYRIASPPSLGYVTGAPPNVLYISTTNFSTTVTDSFTFIANDGLTDSVPATISITLLPQTSTLPVVSVVATDAQAAEPPPTNNGAFTFTRTGNTQLPLTVLFRISGTATLNTDYQTSPPLASGTTNTIYFRTIPTNSSSATITVIPLADTNIEGTETVVLTLFTNSAYTIGGPGSATVSILDNTNPPPPPVLNIVTTDPLAYEFTGSGGTDTAGFMVTRTGTPNSIRFPITVSGTATYGIDYYTVPAFQVSSNSSTTFFDLGANQNSLAFTLYPLQDILAEGTETAIFRLGTNVGYTIGPSNQSVISILDVPQPAQIIFPSDGSVFASPQSINIKAEATNALELRIYADDRLLAISNPPASATFMLVVSTNFSPGEHTVYAAGTNRLGLITSTFTSAPVHFQVLAPLAPPMAPSIGSAPASSSSHVIDENGALFDWGSDSFGQLGDGILPPSHAVTSVVLPEQIPLGDGTNRWIKVAGGANHALALTSSGRLYSTGENGSGQLGLGNVFDQSVFMPVPFPTNVLAWKEVAAGESHSLGLATDGRLFSWGNNSAGQLGLGGRSSSFVATFVPFPPGVNSWSAIAAGGNFSVALADNGRLYSCGSGISGALGTGGTIDSLVFVPVSVPGGTTNSAGITNWSAVTAGFQHVLAIAGNHALYAWGLGTSGQLGNGGFTNATLPTLVSPPAGVTNWLALAGGIYHSLALADNGELYGWGTNVRGVLGPGPVTRAVPTPVIPPSGVATWKGVGAGFTHSLAISDNCTLYAWGANNLGQLGIGSFVDQTNETPVQNLNTLCAAFTNQQPIAFSQFLVATQGTIVPITLTASDPDNDPLTYQIVVPPSLGYLTGAPPNILYISTTNFLTTVTDRFDFVANDGHTDSFPATVTLLLLPPTQSSNTLPVVTITSTDTQASEFLNSDGTTNAANFTIHRSGPTNDSLQVLLGISGTANYRDYYTLPPLNGSSRSNVVTVSIPSGSLSVPFALYGLRHALSNSPATAIFTLLTNSSYTVASSDNQVTISIVNNSQPARIFFPPDGSVFASPLDIELRVAGTNVSSLKLYADNNLLASTSAPPGSATFIFNLVTNFPAGSHTVYSAGDSITSAPVHFFVQSTNSFGPHAPSLGKTAVANSSFVIDANGALFDWGYDGFANLGDGGVSNTFLFAGVTLPIQIPLPASGAAWAKVASGGEHTLAVDSLGNIYATGDNTYGQMGIGSSSIAFTNVLLSAARILRCKDVAAGNWHSLALTTDGQIYAWGYNDFGQLGNGTTTNAPFPRLVSLPPGVSNWTAIAAGVYHSLALGNDGNAYAWGYAEFGALGNGAFTNAAIPQRVVLPAGITNWLKIAAGGYHNLALAGNGKLYAWGYSGVGTLGNGGVTNVSIPVLVNAPSNVVNWAAISAGILHSLALAEDGSAYGWGDNSHGQLGPNAGSLEPMPFLITPPTGVQSWQQISAGAFHTLAISDSCMAYSWGSNSLGQLGVGSFVAQTNLQLVHNLGGLCSAIVVTETNHAPSFVKGPDITVLENAGIQVFTNWATQINPGAPSETNQILTFIVTNDNPHLFSTQPGIVPSGSLFFAGAPNSNGVAHITVVLKDNGGTANGGQDTSVPQSFVITITPPNHPPVPVVRVFPLFVLSSNYCAFQVISPNGSNAVVYFDASHSSDADGDPLTFAWFDNGTNHLFGSTVVATNVLALGTNSLILAVNDGRVTVLDPFMVDVISVGDAVGELIGLVQTLASSHSGTKPNTWKQLIDSLQAAQSEFEKGLWNAGLVHMRIFEFRVLTQIGPSDPALANNLISIAQQIVNVVQSSARHQPTIRGLQSQGSNHKSLSFTGATGEIYLVQASSDLTHWETIGLASETDAGNFQFDDTNSGGTSARFYRLVVP